MAEIKMRTTGVDDHVKMLTKIAEAVAEAAPAAVKAGGQVIADRANQLLGMGEKVIVKPRKLAASNRAAVWIGLLDDFWYLRFFEYGASPHEIRPKAAQALRSFSGQGLEFSEGHVAGGMAAAPFFRPAIDQSRRNVIDAMLQIYRARQTEAIK